MRRLDWISETLDRLIFPAPNMPLCARAWWCRDRLGWRLWVVVFDRLLALREDGHCRRCYGRRWL